MLLLLVLLLFSGVKPPSLVASVIAWSSKTWSITRALRQSEVKYCESSKGNEGVVTLIVIGY